MKERKGKCKRFPHDQLWGYPSVGEDDSCGEWEIKTPDMEDAPVKNCTGCKHFVGTDRS